MNDKYKINSVLDHYEYRLKRNQVLRDPDKMTFDPDFAAIQYEHKVMLANTNLRQYFKYNSDARAKVYLILYFIVVAICAYFLYVIETNATII